MNQKRVLSILLAVFLLTPTLFAHGKKDVEEKDVKNMNSWQETFDLEGKKKGKYNIMITAKDLGGNTYIEGPHNIFVDPDSDLCIPSITNPVPDMRVVGNLNIVGTCKDDDGMDRVELILDGNTTVNAVGGEFWSYYLDTTDLEEGAHTIEVVGYDINGLEGKHTKLTWQLDRRQPVTSIKEKDMITDRAMGQLVSGTVKFAGLVEDGNGIKSLSYSLDNGEHFQSVKIRINDKKKNAEFDVIVNTKEFNDGPAVLWFKAVDNSGSTGIYSFLYYIDNTKPDVKIISPSKDRKVNGKFSIAGFAKDAIGITSLTWTYGKESGEIELIPGNPYWSLDFDTTNGKEKSERFAIRAVDKADNVVEVAQTIQLDQEADKPVVVLAQPASGDQYSSGDDLYVRGIATDDDGVAKVKISLDGGEPVFQETKGVFYHLLGDAGQFSYGKHRVTVSAIDVNGVEGNPSFVEFFTCGRAPEFGSATVTQGKDTAEFVNGMEVHPESGSAFNVAISSMAGLKSVTTEYSTGNTEPVVSEIPLKNVSNYTATIPVSVNMPMGVLKVKVAATDIYDRTTEYAGLLYVTNTTKIKKATPVVVFDDSTVKIEDGRGLVVNNSEFPASGYLLGDIATYAELVPSTPFATAVLNGNQIQLIPGTAQGSSAPVVVRVTTAKGDKYDSLPIVFSNDTALPELTINEFSESGAIDLNTANIEISGKAKCVTGMNKVKYRLLSSSVEMAKGIISKVNPVSVSDFSDAEMKSDGSFAISIPAESLGDGVYIVEVTAVSSAGNMVSVPVCAKKIPVLEPDAKGKMPKPKTPVVMWFDGYDVYAAGVYQGELSETYKAFSRSEMIEGSNALAWTAVDETGKGVAGKYTAMKAPTLSANIAHVNGQTYMSGMPVAISYGTDKNAQGATLTAYIDTGAAVSAVTYEIYGDSVAGGDVRQTGSAKLTKPVSGEIRWIAEVPLKNLPARITKVKLNIKAGGMEKSIEGTVEVVRPSDDKQMDDNENIYTLPSADTKFDSETNTYFMGMDSRFYFYANYPAPISVDLRGANGGLEIETINNLVVLKPVKDGTYKGVTVRVTDILGDVHESRAINVMVDSGAPDLNIETPVLNQWMGNFLKISGTAADPLGVKYVEYSLDNGATWEQFLLRSGDKGNLGVTYSKEINITEVPDGLIQVDVRASDTSGHVVTKRVAVYKDVTPPEVSVVVPLNEDIVNGETLIVFDVKDNALLNKTEYVLPPSKGRGKPHVDVPLRPLVSTLIGIEEKPIDDSMAFEFYDDAGNKTSIESWAFLIDNESDLPVSEIHVPEENQVITRDFTISGIVTDDDGESTIYYRIDNGEFIKYREVGTSFSIDVPISTMTDNEHTVTVYAIDVNGVKGPETKRTYRVSLAEPKAVLIEPDMDTSVRGVIKLSGWANDKNGIADVKVSLDNGNSYNDTVLKNVSGPDADWEYTVDSRAIPGGSQVVFLKTTDKYGIQGLYSSLINIDNQAPVLSLDLPKDESTTTGQLFFSGYSYDNLEITDMHVTIRNLDKRKDPFVTKFPIERVIGKVLDITSLEDGFYNIELTATDAAGNASNVSRNIHLDKNRPAAVVDVLYPLNGEHKTGEFNIYGQAEAEGEIVLLNLYVDNKFIAETTLTQSGFYKFGITQDLLSDGEHNYRVEAVLDTGNKIASSTQKITYSANGPWVTIDNFVYGSFATNRPYLRGRAGYTIDGDELLYSKTKEAPISLKEEVAGKAVAKIELSLDNGRTYIPLSTGDKWQYRVENQDWSEGYHFLLLRATMKNGEVAIERTIVQIDNTKPRVNLIGPEVGQRYNQQLEFSGLSGDDVGLENVTVTLRKGDKASYEVPSFIQGLYLDFHFWGATLFDVGAGLTFFDDNVKLQFQWGQYTQAQRDAVSNLFKLDPTALRYGGNVFGIKLLANITSIPFSYFFGHDFDWLSAGIAVGANFSLFTETNSGTPQILSAAVVQLEFPRVKFTGTKAFSQISAYTEGSVWFIPTDIQSTNADNAPAKILPQISIGIRANVF